MDYTKNHSNIALFSCHSFVVFDRIVPFLAGGRVGMLIVYDPDAGFDFLYDGVDEAGFRPGFKLADYMYSNKSLCARYVG